MVETFKLRAPDFQDLRRRQALEKLNFLARQKFQHIDDIESFKTLTLSRDVFLPVSGLNKIENHSLYQEWKRRRSSWSPIP